MLRRRTLEGRGQVRGIKLRAGALRAFVEAPAHRFRNHIAPLAAVLPPQARVAELERAALGVPSDEEAFGLLTRWLLALRRDDAQSSLAVAIADRIACDRSILSVDALADVSGLGLRPLQRLFREHVGATPKWVIRRHRLQEAALRIERDEPTSLAMLATDLGYVDQAHFTRDFKAAVGKAPSEFASSVISRGSS